MCRFSTRSWRSEGSNKQSQTYCSTLHFVGQSSGFTVAKDGFGFSFRQFWNELASRPFWIGLAGIAARKSTLCQAAARRKRCWAKTLKVLQSDYYVAWENSKQQKVVFFRKNYAMFLKLQTASFAGKLMFISWAAFWITSMPFPWQKHKFS